MADAFLTLPIEDRREALALHISTRADENCR
jgi:hypothetical protein